MKFSKGQVGYKIDVWSRTGSVAIRRVRVTSCGIKQMTLVDDENEKLLGRAFRPEYTNLHIGVTLEQANELAMEFGRQYIVAEHARFDRCLAAGESEGYNAAIRRDKAALLTEPVIIDRTGVASRW